MYTSDVLSALPSENCHIASRSQANSMSWLDAESCQSCYDSTLRYSSNATASNLVGPGRTLGKIYKVVGRRLENALGRIAERAGHGPRQISHQIEGALLHHGSNVILPEDEPNVMRLCATLLGYTQSAVGNTQITSLGLILGLCVWSPSLKEIMLKSNAEVQLTTLLHRYKHGHITATEIRGNNMALFFSGANAVLLALKGSDIHENGRVICPYLIGEKCEARWFAEPERGICAEVITRTPYGLEYEQKWRGAFKNLLACLRDPRLAWTAILYFDWWCYFVNVSAVEFDLQLAVDLCQSCTQIMQQVDLFTTVDHMDLEFLSRSLHSYLLSRFNARPIKDGDSLIVTCSSSSAQSYAELDVLNTESVIAALNSLNDELERKNLRRFEWDKPLKRLCMEATL